jgi:hypothetical protein
MKMASPARTKTTMANMRWLPVFLSEVGLEEIP